MPVRADMSQPTPLSRPVYTIIKASHECENDPMLASLSCRNGPAAAAVQGKIADLLSGAAWGLTVALLVEEETDTPLAVASVYLDGHPRRWTFPMAYTKRIGGNPHIDLVARDDHFHNCVLLDQKTRLGIAALIAPLEVVLRERPSRTGRLPLVWAFVLPENSASLRAFRSVGFHARRLKRPPGVEGEHVLVRRSGMHLPRPNRSAYRPVLQPHGNHEHPLAA
jgi:hypothetical protein